MIVQSTYTVGPAQVDGRRYVEERHTDSTGYVHVVGYLAAIGTDYAAVMAARVPGINKALREAEADKATSVVQMPVLIEQTLGQFAEWFWLRADTAQRADKIEFGRLMWWLVEMVTAGHITQAQARNAFNAALGRSLTAQQFTELSNTRFIPAHDRYAALLSEGPL